MSSEVSAADFMDAAGGGDDEPAGGGGSFADAVREWREGRAAGGGGGGEAGGTAVVGSADESKGVAAADADAAGIGGVGLGEVALSFDTSDKGAKGDAAGEDREEDPLFSMAKEWQRDMLEREALAAGNDDGIPMLN